MTDRMEQLQEEALADLRKQGIEPKVTSAYRSPAYNRQVGGAPGSQHIQDNARDISLEGLTPEQQRAVTARFLGDKRTGGFGYYPHSNSIHVDARGGDRTAWGSDYSHTSVGKGWPQWLTQDVNQWRTAKGTGPVDRELISDDDMRRIEGNLRGEGKSGPTEGMISDDDMQRIEQNLRGKDKRNLVIPGQSRPTAGGRVEYTPGEVYTPAQQAAGAQRGIAGQVITGAPVVGPLLEAGEAAARAIPPSTSGGPGYGERFSGELQRIRQGNEAFAAENPGTATAAQTAGALGTFGAGATTAAGRAVMGASGSPLGRFIGGGIGQAGVSGLDTLLRGGGQGNVLREAGIGGALGAVGALGAELGNSAGRTVANLLEKPPPGLSGLNRHALELLSARGLSDLSITQLQQMAKDAGPNAMLGDITPGMRDITKGLASVQGPGKDIITGAYDQRAQSRFPRVESIVSKYLGPETNIEALNRVTTQNQKAAATPLYNQFRSTPIPITPELKDLIPRLQGVGALGEAKFLASATGRPIDMKQPTAETWDLAKRGLDSLIEKAYSSGNKTRASALIGLKNDLISNVEASPGASIWKKARDAFAEPAEYMKQLSAGENTFKAGREGLTADELGHEWSTLGAKEKEARIIGLRGFITEAMGATGTGDASMLTKLLTPNAQKKLKIMLPNADDLITELKQEKFLAERHQDVVPNRNTGASNIVREEAASLFRKPPPSEFDVTKPATYPLVKRMMPQNIIYDIQQRGREQAAPEVARLLTRKPNTDLLDLLDEARGQIARRGFQPNSRAERVLAGLLAGPGATGVRRSMQNARKEQE